MTVVTEATTLPIDRLETKLPDKAPLYTRGEAITEANRCIYCSDAPCVQACPTGIDIPTFIHKIATDNVKGSARTIFAQNLLGYSCARVCPVEVLCAGSCVYNQWGRPPIEIGRLQRYATENALARDPDLLKRTAKPATGKKIACIGAGPASLAAAGHLALDGHSVTIFEKRLYPGGLNTTGVAPYKLHAHDALGEVEAILGLGDITVKTGVEIDDAAARTLAEDFDAVFIGIGLGPDRFLGLEGPGTVGATEYIERLKLDPSTSLDGVRTALVVGGGNTAIDVARELALLGVPDVAMVYRKTEAQMSGYHHEMVGARKDGVRLIELRNPVAAVREARSSSAWRVARPTATARRRCPAT
ncbi:MAG: FAD-dependent oxidoreductase [Sandaracinaceae bacterium]